MSQYTHWCKTEKCVAADPVADVLVIGVPVGTTVVAVARGHVTPTRPHKFSPSTTTERFLFTSIFTPRAVRVWPAD